MIDIANFDPIEAKRQAKAEIEGYRERVRLEQAAKALAAETAAEEIAREVHRRRQDEAARDTIRAEYQRIMAQREIALAAQAKAEREQRIAANPSVVNIETPARRLAKSIRAAFGDSFGDILNELRTIPPQQLYIELRRIPDDEKAEAIVREQAARAAAVEVPEPEDVQEQLILARYGLAS